MLTASAAASLGRFKSTRGEAQGVVKRYGVSGRVVSCTYLRARNEKKFNAKKFNAKKFNAKKFNAEGRGRGDGLDSTHLCVGCTCSWARAADTSASATMSDSSACMRSSASR